MRFDPELRADLVRAPPHAVEPEATRRGAALHSDPVVSHDEAPASPPPCELPDHAARPGVPRGVVQRFERDQKHVPTHRKREGDLGQVLGKHDREDGRGPGEQPAPPLRQIVHEGPQGLSAGPERSDDVREGRPRLRRGIADLPEDTASLRLVHRVVRCEVGEEAEAPELRAELVVQVHRDSRALSLHRDHVSHPEPVRRDGDAEAREADGGEEPAPPPEWRQDTEGDGGWNGARYAVAVHGADLERVRSRREARQEERPLLRRRAPLVRPPEPPLVTEERSRTEVERHEVELHGGPGGRENDLGNARDREPAERGRDPGDDQAVQEDRRRRRWRIGPGMKRRQPVWRSEPEVAESVPIADLDPAVRETVGAGEMPESTRVHLQTVEAAPGTEVEATKPVLGDAGDVVARESLLRRVADVGRPVVVGAIDAVDAPELRRDPEPSRPIEVQGENEAARGPLGSGRLTQATRAVPDQLTVVEPDPDVPLAVLRERGGCRSGEAVLRAPSANASRRSLPETGPARRRVDRGDP